MPTTSTVAEDRPKPSMYAFRFPFVGSGGRLLPGEAIDIPLGAAHRVANRDDTPLVFIEVQTGDYFGEDDIERLEDDYGRSGAGEGPVEGGR